MATIIMYMMAESNLIIKQWYTIPSPKQLSFNTGENLMKSTSTCSFAVIEQFPMIYFDTLGAIFALMYAMDTVKSVTTTLAMY